MPPLDPETKQPYGYRIVGTAQFELCATFRTHSNVPGASVVAPRGMYPSPEMDPTFSYWEHQSQRTCYIRTINPARYPPRLKKPE